MKFKENAYNIFLTNFGKFDKYSIEVITMNYYEEMSQNL